MMLILLLVALNYIYTTWFFEKDIQKYSEVVNLVRSVPKEVDVIYIGESSNVTYRSDDSDKRSISAFISDYFPNLVVCDITKPAAHAGIFYPLLSSIPDSFQISTVIVTLNLRSFNADWIYSKLETPLQKSLVLLNNYPPLVNRFLLSFKAYDVKNDAERIKQVKNKWENEMFFPADSFKYINVAEWDYNMAMTGIKDSTGQYCQSLTELACHYIKAYAFQIDTLSNPRISDFDKIVKLADKRGWNLVFNLLPENTQKAGQLVGSDLIHMMDQNAWILTDYFTRRGVLVVNNLHLVDDEQFVDQNWTTEHYAQYGRQLIANRVANNMKRYHENEFKVLEKPERYQTVFFNDCEGEEIWGQMQTLSTDHSFLGEKSSIAGAGNDYSITFEYPIKIIPDSLKNKVLISFWMYQSSLNHDAKLVIQASGDNLEDYWNGFALQDVVNTTNEWSLFSLEPPIPDSVLQADLFKVYIYNPSNTKIFIDDFKIKFD